MIGNVPEGGHPLILFYIQRKKSVPAGNVPYYEGKSSLVEKSYGSSPASGADGWRLGASWQGWRGTIAVTDYLLIITGHANRDGLPQRVLICLTPLYELK